MVKINKNSVTIAVYKKVASYIRKLCGYIDIRIVAPILVTIVLILFFLSVVAYGERNKDFASILLLTYIVIIAGCCISRLYNGMIALLVFAIPIFSCILTITSTDDMYMDSYNKCRKVEKRLQYDTEELEYLKYWYKNNCGGN